MPHIEQTLAEVFDPVCDYTRPLTEREVTVVEHEGGDHASIQFRVAEDTTADAVETDIQFWLDTVGIDPVELQQADGSVRLRVRVDDVPLDD